MVNVKWENGEFYVAIEGAITDFHGGNVFVVESDAFTPGPLPVDWREPVLQSDDEAVEKLINSVKKWAKENGYTQTIEPST